MHTIDIGLCHQCGLSLPSAHAVILNPALPHPSSLHHLKACSCPAPPLLPAGGAPIYAPKAVRFRLGGIACFAPDGTRLSPLQLAEAARADLQGGQAAQQAQQGGDAQQQAPAPAGPGGAAQQVQQVQQAGGGRRGQPQIDWVWESDIYTVLSQDESQVNNDE